MGKQSLFEDRARPENVIRLYIEDSPFGFPPPLVPMLESQNLLDVQLVVATIKRYLEFRLRQFKMLLDADHLVQRLVPHVW
ncbi:MAG: hypothetical protein ACLPTQ_00590 [Terriglobales bacterium]